MSECTACRLVSAINWIRLNGLKLTLSSGLDDIRLTITNFESFSNLFRFKAGASKLIRNPKFVTEDLEFETSYLAS